MKNSQAETRFLIYVLAAISALMMIHIFHPQLSKIYDPVNYVSFHTVLEFFSISVSMTIFLYCWKTYEKSKSSAALWLMYTFYTVGIIDLFHTLTFKGMPFFITESTVQKATYFWIAGRAIEAGLMVKIMFMKDEKLRRDWRWSVIFASLATIAVTTVFIFTFEGLLPQLVIEGEGTTPLKNLLEYIISAMHLLALVMCLYKYYLNKQTVYLNLGMAFTLLFLSELIFTVYRSVYDLDNFSGHIFKVLGYYFILKGIHEILLPVDEYKEEAAVAESIVKKNPGAIFSITKKDDNFIFSYIEGGMIRQLGFHPEQMAGTSVEDFLPASGGDIMDYCNSTWDSGENQTFMAQIKNHSYLISLVPVIEQGITLQITGTATEITSFTQQGTPQKQAL
ncbi:MASE3 domain-containing protein [Bacillus sp. FJAT-18017]|uniref:MASE3 domain-containing protein n=1 Tax=Bacillus sp. FJAT-18017 TaxID=1705566 RepID=UPI0006AE94A3|nr:MASE3 domain-containing protein [Bacillus sp. FJAT-18017]